MKIGNLQELISYLVGIMNTIVPLIILLALLYFLYGVTQLLLSPGEEKKHGEARTFILYGLIALFVMLSVWGLVNVLLSTFPLDNGPLQLHKFL